MVAAGLGVADVELPDDVRAWLSGVDPAAWPPLAQDAVAALDRVLGESELRDLWAEVGDGFWEAATRALRDQIDAAARPPSAGA